MKKLTLRELCEQCGVSRRAVQGYEQYGLVEASGKTNRGYLLYDEETQQKVKQIRDLQNYGFTVKEIVEYQGKNQEERREILRKKLRWLRSHRNCTDRYIQEIKRMILEGEGDA